MVSRWFSVWGLATALMVLAGQSWVCAAEFSALMLQTRSGTTSQSRLYVRDEMYRMDMKEGSTEFFVLVDRKEGLTWVVFPEDKEFMEMKNTSVQSLMNNPFESFRHSARQYELREVGRESFKGFDCRKVLVHSGDQALFQAWISDELGFPLKIANELEKGMLVELDRIQQGRADPSLFDIPDDYEQMKMPGASKPQKAPGPKKKPWMDKVASAEVLNTPVKKGDMGEGDIFRVSIAQGKALSIFASGGVRIYAFRQGQPVVKFVNSGRLNVYLSPEEADEIVLYNPTDSRFRDHARVKQGDMPERVLAAGEEKSFTMQPGGEFVARFINIVDSESTVFHTWHSQGEELPDSEMGPKSFRTKNLRAGKNFRSIHNQLQGKAPGDELLVRVLKGRVLVKAGQPFQPRTVQDTVQQQADPKPEPAKTGKKNTRSAQTVHEGDGSAKIKPATSKSEQHGGSGAANIMFILDASGSMWGEVEGRDKIAIAKEVMAGLIRDLPDNTRAGLVAYGHRRKGDCQDVEELVPIGPLDRDTLIRTIQGLSPKGKTPITRSVRVTAEKLKALEDETTIILVSDGRETCGGDPCALVRELKEAGLQFVMHVIGFDVTAEEREQLECMAEAGGGRYFTAKTAGEFEAAAQEVVQETRTVGFLEVTALRNGKPVSAHVQVFIPEKEEIASTARTSLNRSKPRVMRLQPGTYAVKVTDTGLSHHPSKTFADVQIELGKTIGITAEFEASSLKVMALKDGQPAKAYAYIFRGEERVARGSLKGDQGRTFDLLPGSYDVQVRDNSVPDKPEVWLKGVQIGPGETVERTAEFTQQGWLKLEAVKGGQPAKAYAYIFRGEERVARGSVKEDQGRTFDLLPGVYDLEVKGPDKEILEHKGIRIQSGQTETVTLQF